MHLLCYISVADSSVDEKELFSILESSCKNNAADDITGMLLFHNGQFLQVLEGPKSAVEACFARISNDSRHVSVAKLLDEELPARCFSQWSMASAGLEHCSHPLRQSIIDLFNLHHRIEYMELKRNAVVGLFVDTYLSDLEKLRSAIRLAAE